MTRDDLIAHLRKQGRDVPDGDGWGWEFEPDPWAAAAADMLEADSDLLAAIARADHEPADETVLPVDAVLPDGWWWIDDPADRLAGYDEAGR